MEPFIRSDQYNFIKAQTQVLINGHASAKDVDVLNALKSIAQEKIFNSFVTMDEEQRQLIAPIEKVEDKHSAEEFLAQLQPYVIPFQITEQAIKKLFPKAKKLKTPPLQDMDLRETSYLGWNDPGSSKKFIIAPYKNKQIGIHGSFRAINKKGICALCNRHEEVGMFIVETKWAGDGTFTKRGNYICQDSQKCNQNLTTLDKLTDFIGELKR
ncbi:FusB/FusC family EF-G-binding protein [Microbacteriaceae bacterium 4G12]